jgi:hypothetical protein
MGRGISGGSTEVQGSAKVYLYSMQEFALAIIVHEEPPWSKLFPQHCIFTSGQKRNHKQVKNGLYYRGAWVTWYTAYIACRANLYTEVLVLCVFFSSNSILQQLIPEKSESRD